MTDNFKLLEKELRKLVMDGKIHPNTAREALNKLEASLNLKSALDEAEASLSFEHGYKILRRAIEEVIK
jgi:hypothetical protein